MRIAIVDDDARDREQILSCLSQYFSKAEKACETTVFEDAVSFLSDYHYEFDFIILDIDMPEISGIDAAKSLREKDPNVTLMFVTNMPQYAIEAYTVEAMDYVLKPISYPDFALKMKKAERYIARNADAPFVIQTKSGAVRRMVSEILYVESYKHYLYYHTASDSFKARGKLSEAEEKLRPYHFAKAGESYLVNLAHLKSLDGNNIIVGEERLPVSRRCRSELLSAFTRYRGGF